MDSLRLQASGFRLQPEREGEKSEAALSDRGLCRIHLLLSFWLKSEA
jgi:hypothetical protein